MRKTLTFLAGAMAFIALAGNPANAYVPTFCGAGRGPTEAVAVAGAVDDATMSARDMGLFGTCTFAEPPVTMQFFNDPLHGDFWRASVQLHCAQ
jgi:hypothetical protein